VPNLPFLSVITLNADLSLNHIDFSDTATTTNTSLGVAVGRFDPLDTSTGPDFNQQIAGIYFDTNSNVWDLRFYTVDPQTFTPAFSSSWSLGENLFPVTPDGILVSPLQVGDLQGRSLLLGAPDKITVGHTQPDTVLGMPPMHVDFIVPPTGGNPLVQNVTVFPSTFNTAYDFQVTTGSQASRQSATSYTAATKESAGAQVSFGVPSVASVSAEVKASATQTHKSTVANNYNTYSGETYTFNTTTQFDDKVAATSEQMNIYAYPLIGQSVCPQQSPNCPDDCAPGPAPCPLLPLQIQFSGPDNIQHLSPTDAVSLEWFQPLHEPGNLFSYPGSLALLEAGGPQFEEPTLCGGMTTTSRLDGLTPTGEVWGSQSSESFSIDWSQGGGSDVTSGTVSNHAFDGSVTVAGKATFEGVGVSASASLDYSQSTALSTLNTATQTFGDSTGVTLNRGIGAGGNASDDVFLYAGQSYIFGQCAPTGTIQSDLQVDTTVQSQGYLQVGHAADPLSTDLIQSGDWWKQVYTVAPDVALNHPQRWTQKEPTSQNDQQVRFNCPIGYTSAFGTPTADPGACTSTTTTPTPMNVTNAPFYQMKGLFVTPGTSPGGPPTTLATLGDTLTLQARVYNYSLANFRELVDERWLRGLPRVQLALALPCSYHRKARGVAESMDRDARSFGEQVLEVLDTLMEAVYRARGSLPSIPLREALAPMLAKLFAACRENANSRHAKTRALARKLLNDWDTFWVVLDHPEPPLTNNTAERALRHYAELVRL
jgi:hypothetical protein